MIIADFTKALVNKDYVALSKCFSDKSRLFDYCPSGMGKENFFVCGDKAVEMFYHNKFILGRLSVQDAVITNERSANFYINYGGPVIHAQATIESYDPNTGLISEMVIRPA